MLAGLHDDSFADDDIRKPNLDLKLIKIKELTEDEIEAMAKEDQKRKGKKGNVVKKKDVEFDSDFEFQMTYFGLIGTCFDVFVVVENQTKLKD